VTSSQLALPENLRFVLLSASPRRRRLLPLLGAPVEIAAAAVDERPLPGEPPCETARRLAEAKAGAVAVLSADDVVVGADTIVVLDGRQLGKPADDAEARQVLATLRGRSHEVLTGVALRSATRTYVGCVSTQVAMRPYLDAEIERYVSSGRPLDKAGGYAIQDQEFSPVARIEGCFLNVVGLPLCEVVRGLQILELAPIGEDLRPPCRWCELGSRALEEQLD
jgi:MAF protein